MIRNIRFDNTVFINFVLKSTPCLHFYYTETVKMKIAVSNYPCSTHSKYFTFNMINTIPFCTKGAHFKNILKRIVKLLTLLTYYLYTFVERCHLTILRPLLEGCILCLCRTVTPQDTRWLNLRFLVPIVQENFKSTKLLLKSCTENVQ